MINTNLFENSPVRKITSQLGSMAVLEYQKDVSVNVATAQTAYYMSEMGLHKKQLICSLKNSGIILQAGAMQIITGDVNMTTNVQGAGDLFKKMVGAKVTGETAIKPRYSGTGTVLCEPTYKYIILQDLAEWNGAMTIEDGLFLACDETVDMKIVVRTNLSSAALGGEGLFNTSLQGSGVVALESNAPQEELLVYDLDNDCVKIDGNMAIAWSTGLKFTVEKSSRSLIGSAASGEGLVNVYRGTGRILVAPV